MIKVYQHLNVCDVCRLIDNDETPKACAYCSLCDSYICQRDQSDWWRRGKAFLKRRLEKGFRGDPNYRTD